ncbi:MAG: sensor histidine kinase, partial [Limisphaerales bacterium]
GPLFPAHGCVTRMFLSVLALLFLYQVRGAFETSFKSPTAESLQLLTNIAQIRLLSSEEAGRGYPVTLKAIVTFRTHRGNLFIRDDTAGLYVQVSDRTSTVGESDEVEITGRTASGDYAPIILAQQVRTLGRAELPPPAEVSFDELGSSGFDCEWVQVRGVVRSAVAAADERHDLEVAVQGGRLRVYLLGYDRADGRRLVDARVRLTGVRGCIFNHKGQVLAPLLFVSATNLVTEEFAPSDPFAAPTRAVATLLKYTPESRPGHRVKVRGIVLHQEPGESVFLRDQKLGLRLKTRETNALRAGEIIEAVGFESVGAYAPFLEDTIYRRVGAGPKPLPREVSVQQALDGTHDGDLVRINGRLVDVVERGSETLLVLQKDGVLFHAQMKKGDKAQNGEWLNGSELQLSGICLVQDVVERRSTVKPESFSLLLRSAEDLRVLKHPPWLTERRRWWALTGITGLFVGALGIVTARSRSAVRAQDRERAEAEARWIAIMAERNRMAREIHDTLAQGFTAVSVQLEAIRDKVEDSPDARKHLELARTFVRSSLAEARRSIWDMRSQALEDADLAKALANIANQLTGATRIKVDLVVKGEARRLPVTVENNLLRIGQEAITNAVKHVHPQRILIELTFGASAVVLRVRDDGIGFHADSPKDREQEGFGLVGMRERVQPLGARLEIKSKPGRGTEIVVETPVA